MMPAKTEFTAPKPLANRLHTRDTRKAILVIDDDRDFLELVCAQVSRIADTEVECAGSCEDAVERLASRSFQLVICDWALAKRTGPEVFSLADPLLLSVRKPRSKIPVMFMSGSEKVASTQGLRSFQNFTPVTFIIKNLGAPLIRVMAENVLLRFYDFGQENDSNSKPASVYLS